MKFTFSLFMLLATCFIAKAQNADDIIGNWKNGEGSGIIQIYKTTSGHYAGKIVWLKEPIDPETGKPKLDKRNPDESLRTVPTLGLINLKGFSFDQEDKNWVDGTIYDPKNGKEYSCKAELTSKNVLEVRGYIGVSLLGRTDTWTRMVKK
ncbi:MAG TPA: DUF2147 domain-containing protein [Chitinophagaceae bacterium]|jgi:uncharacterized protein (DUF2147 family)|nr:DUF2147 domain-containing protein [Chitinophagaceae bacterium]